jgi:hypothetical protein
MGGTGGTGGADLRIVNRLAVISGFVMIAVGALGSLASLVSMWQGQQQIAGRVLGFNSTGSDSAPTIADRITFALQYGGGYIFFALLLVAAGVALVVAGAHLPDRRAVATEPRERWPEPPVIEVPLEVEDRAWAPVSPRPDENPLRP